MEDRLQISQARVEEDSENPDVASSAVFYEAKKEAVIFLGNLEAELLAADELAELDMAPRQDSSLDGGYISEGDTMELLKAHRDQDKDRSCSSCYGFCKSYRSVDPDLRVTPFAVILLAILFVVYVLNQADRLTLPVAIPSGLRCEVSIKDECRNTSSVPIYTNTSSNDTDCVHFSDNEQGLLTGMCTT